MAVSRTGKRGTRAGHMIPESRNRRVKRNAGLKSITRPGVPIGERALTVALGHGWCADDIRPANLNDNIAPLALRHGRYEVADTIFRPSVIETEIEPRVVNRTVTVIDGWIDEEIFDSRDVRIIEYCRDLWRDIRRPTHPYFDPPDLEDRLDSFEAERAKNLLRRCRQLVGRIDWSIFENVIRWNEPIGIPGSHYAVVSAGNIAAAQEVVVSVAKRVGRARIL